MIRQIYLDMDGVLVDLAGTLTRMGVIESNYDRDEFWQRMAIYGTDLWANAHIYPWAADLVAACYQAVGMENVFILSAPSRTCDPVCSGKTMWLRKHFPEFVYDGRVIFAKRKYLLAQPDRLLIDDKVENLSKFDKAGGETLLFCPDTNRDSQVLLTNLLYLRKVGQPETLPAGVQSSSGLSYRSDLAPLSD